MSFVVTLRSVLNVIHSTVLPVVMKVEMFLPVSTKHDRNFLSMFKSWHSKRILDLEVFISFLLIKKTVWSTEQPLMDLVMMFSLLMRCALFFISKLNLSFLSLLTASRSWTCCGAIRWPRTAAHPTRCGAEAATGAPTSPRTSWTGTTCSSSSAHTSVNRRVMSFATTVRWAETLTTHRGSNKFTGQCFR